MDRKEKNSAQHQMSTKEAVYILGDGISDAIDESLGNGYGFALLMFPFGESSDIAFFSNISPTDTAAMLREASDRMEARQDMSPGANSIN